MTPSHLPAAADPRRSMPAHPGARHDAIETALHVLGEEAARLDRLGLEAPREHCREARRFWGFVGALHQLADQDSVAALRRGDAR